MEPLRKYGVESSGQTDVGIGCNADVARVLSYAFQGNLHIALMDEPRELLSPLDQEDAVRCDQIVEAESFQLSRSIDAIQIDVIEVGTGPTIFMDEGEGRA